MRCRVPSPCTCAVDALSPAHAHNPDTNQKGSLYVTTSSATYRTLASIYAKATTVEECTSKSYWLYLKVFLLYAIAYDQEFTTQDILYHKKVAYTKLLGLKHTKLFPGASTCCSQMLPKDL